MEYVPSQRFEGSDSARLGAFYNIDLCRQQFANEAFDVVITLDVLEHVYDPHAAIAEIERTLRPGGVHAFTVPRRHDAVTRTRAGLVGGRSVHYLEPVYHGNPIAKTGSLVVTDWGKDTEELASGRRMRCEAMTVVDSSIGVLVPVEVFVAIRS